MIGYTLSQVKDDDGAPIGAVMFFKDLTQVEQLEERERLRDRLASLGEMAAGIAHELKNPLAGIEVMAGLLRRQVPDSKDAQSLLADIISEAKLANAIVVEMLEFVRPVRLQVERTDLADVLQQSVTMAESKAPRGDVVGAHRTCRARAADDRGRPPSALAGVHEPHRQRVRGAGRPRPRSRFRATARDRGRPGVCRRSIRRRRRCVVDVADDGPGVPAESDRSHLQPVLHDEGDRAPASGWRSSGRSSTRTTGGSTSAARRRRAPASG